MIQVGYNKEVSTADSHKIVSLAFDYTRADTDLFGVSGSGSSDRYGLNLYYTVLGESGSYADFNAKIGRLGSDSQPPKRFRPENRRIALADVLWREC